MLTTSTRTPLVYDDEGYAFGTTVRINTDDDGYYSLQVALVPPYKEGDTEHGRYLTIMSHDGASSCVHHLTVFQTGTAYVNWIGATDNTTWDYSGVDYASVLTHFLMTASLGSTGNFIKNNSKTGAAVAA